MLTSDVGPDSEITTELRSILTAVKHLPPRTETDPDRVQEGLGEAEVIKRRLSALVVSPAAAAAIESAVASFRANPQLLDDLLDAQAYRLCFWRVASDEINYRRFFDVNELAAVAAERDEVFRDTHGLILRFLAEGLADGLRIDHIDGLYAPTSYLLRLQREFLTTVARRLAENDTALGMAVWPQLEPHVRAILAARDFPMSHPPLYVVVEKILGRSERLPEGWATYGTTGYEAIAAIYGMLVDPAGETLLTDIYSFFTGRVVSFPDLVYRRKMAVLAAAFASELGMLTQQLDRLARKNRRARDFTVNGLRRAIRAVIASFPVYRVYPENGVTPDQEAIVRVAVVRARRRSPDFSPDLFDYVRDTLLLRSPPPGAAGPGYTDDQIRFAGKFQQLTSPVTAKGIEDTAFYVYNRMVSLNEVGGDPGRFGWSPAETHQFFIDRQARTPLALNPGATHDTKRGEDVRARLAVMAGRPEAWGRRVRQWSSWNRGFKVELGDGLVAPDPNDEYLLYQTLVGAWPNYAADPDGLRAFADRIIAYMGKALREAKEHTSWMNPNQEYEAAVTSFVSKVLDPQLSTQFLTDLGAFATSVARAGAVNGLAQTVVRCLAPGLPDTYQGTELWDLSLVDPDNRRPVDYTLRAQLLAELDRDCHEEGFIPRLLDQWQTGAVKLFTLSRLLRYRRNHHDLFLNGAYIPIDVQKTVADHVFAFARQHGNQVVLVVVPRFPSKLVDGADRWPIGEVWTDTHLVIPDPITTSTWHNLFTGESVEHTVDLPISLALAKFPVAVLASDPPN
jgi:(1->4)-alpha-D-glucan 1-alpha-D-glucosylmutase